MMNIFTPQTELYPPTGSHPHQDKQKFGETYERSARANASTGLSLLYRFGWMPLYPLVLIFTIIMKFKNRHLANDERYLEHQIEFFSFSRRVQQKLGHECLGVSDKFHQLRPIVNEYALAGHNGERLRMLDVATGCGFQARALKDAGVSEVIGIDIVPERVAEARELFARDGLSFREMDAANLSFPNNYFDAAVVSCALHDMPTCIKRRVIAEIVRVTKPQGNVVIFEPRTFRSRPIGFFLGLVGELLDESMNIKEYVMDDLNPVLEEYGLELVVERNVFIFNLLNIKLCRVRPGAKELTIQYANHERL
jgi:SAM-dependent methyltransferase